MILNGTSKGSGNSVRALSLQLLCSVLQSRYVDLAMTKRCREEKRVRGKAVFLLVLQIGGSISTNTSDFRQAINISLTAFHFFLYFISSKSICKYVEASHVKIDVAGTNLANLTFAAIDKGKNADGYERIVYLLAETLDFGD